VSRRFAGRHRKSRLPSRRFMAVVTGSAAAVVAVTTGVVPLPDGALGSTPGGVARSAQTAEPVTLYAAPGAPPAAGRHVGAESGSGAGVEPGKGSGAGLTGPGAGSPSRSVAPGASATPHPSAAAHPSTSHPSTSHPSAFGGTHSEGPDRATSSPPGSDGGSVPGLPLPLPTVTSSIPAVPVPSLPLVPTSSLPVPLLP
jgi:hypothetical protein